MVPARGRQVPDLSERLQREPYRFDFFQAVRLLERLAREEGPAARGRPVGADHLPDQECVRFRALPSLSFPAAAVAQVRAPAASKAPAERPAPEMQVTFLGLTGASGVLPAHYTATLLRRLRGKDHALRDLLDLFNHRLVSLFYRAWEKYRLPVAYERSRLEESGGQPERVAQALHSLIGLGTAGLRGRRDFPDEAFLYYAGHFAHHPRSAAGLERVLADFFALPLRVLQLQGQWLCLEPDDQAELPSPARPRGRNNRLGCDAVLGDRVWDVRGKFRVRIGPLGYAQFRRFFPVRGDRLRALCQMTRAYVGAEFVFDLQLVLRAEEVPWTRLVPDGDEGAYLGWNTWLRSEPFAREVDDVVFAAADG
jgi:type VI secretion system protein ImpH